MLKTLPINIETVEIDSKNQPHASVIWLHGLGADGYDFVDIVPQLHLNQQDNIRFIFPHAQMRQVTRMGGMKLRAWFDIAELAKDKYVDDEKGLVASQKIIEALIEKELQRGIPANHIVLAGFSQGGAMVLQCGLRYPQRLAGMLVLSGFLPLQDKLALAQHPSNQNTPILMIHGEYDPLIHLDWARLSFDVLKKLRFNAEWQTYPMQHNVCQEEIKKIGNWLNKILS
jgi:phospholipase/carboxylesterase